VQTSLFDEAGSIWVVAPMMRAASSLGSSEHMDPGECEGAMLGADTVADGEELGAPTRQPRPSAATKSQAVLMMTMPLAPSRTGIGDTG
jgi:hypothetical protein